MGKSAGRYYGLERESSAASPGWPGEPLGGSAGLRRRQLSPGQCRVRRARERERERETTIVNIEQLRAAASGGSAGAGAEADQPSPTLE